LVGFLALLIHLNWPDFKVLSGTNNDNLRPRLKTKPLPCCFRQNQPSLWINLYLIDSTVNKPSKLLLR